MARSSGPALKPAAHARRPNRSAREISRRLPRLLFGLTLCGTGIAAMVVAELGLGPWDVLHEGLAGRLSTPIGATSIGVGALVLLLWIPLRERPGLGTVLNVLVIGMVIDLTLQVLPTPGPLSGRIALMLCGPLLFAIGSGFYLGVDLGPGPRDGVMTGLARRGIPVGIGRGSIEMTVLSIGWLLGGTVGVGTVVFAVAIGPLVQIFLPRLAMRDVARTGRDGRGGSPPRGVRSAR